MSLWQYMEIAITLCVGGCIVGSLLLCYCCVFKHLCCPPRGRKTQHNGDKPSPESISLKYVTHLSSQPTDISQVLHHLSLMSPIQPLCEFTMRFWHYLEVALTLVVGGCIVGALLICYTCVFKQLFCPPRRGSEDGKSSPESISLKYITTYSSQATDTSPV